MMPSSRLMVEERLAELIRLRMMVKYALIYQSWKSIENGTSDAHNYGALDATIRLAQILEYNSTSVTVIELFKKK